MEVLSECKANYDHTGAMWVTTIFLGVFALLLIGDCYLTWRALNGALLRDTEEVKRKQKELDALDERIKAKRVEKTRLDAAIRDLVGSGIAVSSREV